MADVKNVLIVGTGGQGVILASNILSDVLSSDPGLQVKKIETHGMSQRGGSVHSQVRFGPQVHAPFISPGEADIILAFEEAEAVRWQHYLAEDGTLLLNNEKIVPPLTQAGLAKYPDGAIAELMRDKRVVCIDAYQIAAETGNTKVVSVVLLGALSALLDFQPQHWLDVLQAHVPEKALAANLTAFEKGREFLHSAK